MIEKVINRKNMQRAYRQVLLNKGSAGMDGMSVKELSAHLKNNREKIATAMVNGKYLPQAILGVEIPKSNGKKRQLGIPTATDRVLQQAVSQAIAMKFEPEFKEHSYGFRPNRNALQAVQQVQKNIHEGYQHIVDIDLQNFFDEVNHCQLLQLLYRKVKCPLTLRLIRLWLRAPILINGQLTKRKKGANPLRSSNRSGVRVEQNKNGRMVRQLAGQSPILITTITLKRLAKRGYESMLDYYYQVAPQLNEPLYARPVRLRRMRGTPRLLTQERPSTRLAVVLLSPVYMVRVAFLLTIMMFIILLLSW